MRIRSHSKYCLSVPSVLLLSGAIVLSGCTRPAKFPRGVSVSDVLNSLRCEFLEAVQGISLNDSWFLKWTASYSLNLKVDRNAGASTNNTTFVVPISLGTFRLGLTANLNGQAFQSMTIDGNFAKLGNFSDYNCPRDDPNYRGRLLAGDLGLSEWLGEVVPELRAPLGAKQPSQARQIKYTMRFVITKEGSVSPRWAVTYSNGRMFQPNFSLGGARKKTHELIITLVKPTDPAKKDFTIIKDKQGNIRTRIVTISNFSELVKRQAEVRKAEKRKENLLTTLDVIEDRISKKTSESKQFFGISKQDIKKTTEFKNFLNNDPEYIKIKEELKETEKFLKMKVAPRKMPIGGIPTTIGPSTSAREQELHNQALTQQILRDSFRDR